MITSKWRTDKGLSQEEAGKLLGLSKSYISLLERGKRSPSRSVIEKLITIAPKYFSPKDFFGGSK
jgi:transcriptional regulator with XRE-family HTH domain